MDRLIVFTRPNAIFKEEIRSVIQKDKLMSVSKPYYNVSMLCILLDCNMFENLLASEFETYVFDRIQAHIFMDSCNEEYI